MKLEKTIDGNFAIIITEKELLDAIGTVKNYSPKPTNPYKHLRKNTVDFIIALKKEYGTNNIMRKDPKLKKLLHTYYITDLAQILKNVKSEVIITYDNCENILRRKILHFKFN